MEKTFDIIAEFVWKDKPVQTNTEPVKYEELQEVLDLLFNSNCIQGCYSITINVHRD